MKLLLPRQEPNPSPLSPGLPEHSEFDPDDYCARRLAGLETGPIPDIGPGTAAAIWVLVALATSFLGLRIYCKIWRSRGIWWDDLVLIISWTMFLASSIMSHRAITLGLGRYACDIHPPTNLSRIAFEGGGLGSLFTVLAIVWSKTSFGITLLRLARDRLRWALGGVVVAMNVAMGLQAVFVWVRCDPVEKNWRPEVGGRCWEREVSNGYAVFSAVLSGVCDVLFALLPWYLVWGLRMRKKEKIGVVVAMSMGVFAGITSFVKSGHIRDMGSKDFTHDGCYLITLATAEIATTIMASCIPVLRVLFRDLRDVTPTEISWTGVLQHYHYHKSDSTGETTKGVVRSPADASVPAEDGNGGNPQETPDQPDQRHSRTAPKLWRTLWDFRKSAGSRTKPPIRVSPAADATPVAPYVAAQNISQRVLVCVSGQSTPSEGAPTEGVIVQTQEFEIKYEGRRPRTGSAAGYEMERIEIQQAK